MSQAIVLDRVSKRYWSINALDGVSLSVNRGELFGLIGPDGAGKSSIYRILATLLIPDSGRATVLGIDTVTGYRDLRRHIGYMPEHFSLYQDLTVKENLEFFATLFGVKVSESYDLIAPVFNRLARFSGRAAGRLSGGMKQKLALCCALIHRPEVLLLDEPTTGVDAVSRSEFWDMLGELRKSGITILVSTSYMDEATRCDRLAMISGGKIIATGTPASLSSRLDGQLYNAVASDMFGLLEKLRQCEGVTACYTFGATLHAAVTPAFDPAATESLLRGEGLPDTRIYPAVPDIEDLFISLTYDNCR
ncbi:MAG: ABC transporter ATP-binding protein [Duncaniella sp.]|nr:ABC transporter ATP-binding protein [Duncaniella sp.]